MQRTMAPAVLTVATLALLLACVVELPLGVWVMAGAVVALPAGLMALAAGPGRYGAPAAFALVLGVSLAALLGFADAGAARWRGLPASTWLLLGGVMLATFVVVTLGYAVGFERHGISARGLEEFRRRVGRPGAR